MENNSDLPLPGVDGKIRRWGPPPPLDKSDSEQARRRLAASCCPPPVLPLETVLLLRSLPRS